MGILPRISPLQSTHPGFKQTVGEFCGVSVAQGEFGIVSKILAHRGSQRERSEEGRADQREKQKIWMNLCPQNFSLQTSLKGPHLGLWEPRTRSFTNTPSCHPQSKHLAYVWFSPLDKFPHFSPLTLLEIELTDLDLGTFLLMYL